MKFARYLFPVVLTLPAVPAVADNLTDLLPPDTKVAFGIRVHNLAISSTAQTFAAQAKAVAAVWLKAVPLDGIDFLRDIDEVLIATSGTGKTPPAIIVVTGRFDVPRLSGGAKRYYHGVPLLEGEAAGDAMVALLDSSTAILGEPNLVRAAIDRRGARSGIDAELNDRITSLRQRYDIWGIGDRPEGFVSPVPEAKVLESVDRFQFGMQMASGLELSAEIHARSAEDAGKLRTAVGMIAAAVKGQTSASAAKFDLQADGGTLKLSVSIPDAELKKTIEAETAALSPVSVAAPVAGSDAEDSGPGAAPEQAALTSAAPPAPAATALASATPPAPPAAAPPATMPSAPKAAAPKVVDQDQDTVVFKLPGKK
jgi:hypothetical protein